MVVVRLVKGASDFMGKPIPENLARQYGEQLTTMCKHGRRWRAEHPQAKVLIQYNYPPKVEVIATISQALKKGFVSANFDGLELIKALWLWGDKSEPTVLMVQTVIENLGENE
jgi:hypothetical protein